MACRTDRVVALPTAAVSVAVVNASTVEAQSRQVQPRRPVAQSQASRPAITDAQIRAWKVNMAQHPDQSAFFGWNYIPADRAVAELRPLLFDVNPTIRIAAARAINGLRAKPASGAVAVAEAIDSAKETRSKVAMAGEMYAYGPAAAPMIPALIRALTPAAKANMADDIYSTLAFIGPTPISGRAILDIMEDSALFSQDQNTAVNGYFDKIDASFAGEAPRIVHMIALSRFRGDSVFQRAVAGLGQPATDALIRELAHRLSGPSAGAMLLATLGYTKSPAALPVLLRYATEPYNKSWADDWGADSREMAIVGLGNMGAAGAPALSTLAKIAAKYNPQAGFSDENSASLNVAATKAIHDIRAAQIAAQ